MKNFIHFFILTTIIFSAYQSQAQQDIGLHFMRDNWISNKTNPAFFPSSHKVHVGLFSVYNSIRTTGFNYSDAIDRENGKTVLDIDKIISSLEGENDLFENLRIETLNVGFSINKLRFSISHQVNVDAIFRYPKTLAQAVFQGNAQFVGQEIEIGPQLDFSTYSIFAFGGAYHEENWQVGARIKFVSGLTNATTDINRNIISLYTDPDIYQLTATTDFVINSSGVIDYNNFEDLNLDFGIENFFGKNTAFTFDIGGAIRLNKFTIAASILDIGNITWDNNPSNYSSNGTIEYDGIEIVDLESENLNFEQVIDTLSTVFEFKETNESYTTTIPTQVYLSATYDLTEKLCIGGLYYGHFTDITNQSAIAVNANYKLFKVLSLGANYAIYDGTIDNLGVNANLTLGPIQLYTSIDNLIGLISQGQNQLIHFRGGLNLVFGKYK